MPNPTPRGQLHQTLYGYQIFFILLTAVIGHGIFGSNGSALENAGPGGLIISIVLISCVTICVGECIGEMTQQFPIPNSMVAYVQEFVDPDLGLVIGLCYWYSYAAAFAIQNATVATLTDYWRTEQNTDRQAWQALAFYVIGPLIMFGLNMTGVFYYGIIETISGALKVVLVIGTSIYLYIIPSRSDTGDVKSASDWFTKSSDLDTWSYPMALFLAIPSVAYSFQGIEITAMAAFEARSTHALRWPSRWTVYAVALFYIMCSVGEGLTVPPDDSHLLSSDDAACNNGDSHGRYYNSMIVVAASNAGHYNIAGFLNCCLIFSVVSAANTSLYASSRSMYGLAQLITTPNWITKNFEWVGAVDTKTGVPFGALLLSTLAFAWLPFLQIGCGREDVITKMSISTSTACMIVWAALCLAYIRYHRWLKKCETVLKRDYPHYCRTSPEYTPRVNLQRFQPVPAWIGLIGCLVFFGFSSAQWWRGRETEKDKLIGNVASAYGVHIVLFVLLVIRKLFKGRLFQKWGVVLTDDGHYLATNVLDPLCRRNIYDRAHRASAPWRDRIRLPRLSPSAYEESSNGRASVHMNGSAVRNDQPSPGPLG
ncbi:amino acid permease-domain-containing protein [Aspergillus ambiguus]|uniref:amino acid permease-domain-containing protein n=1 Tax=Aspergillus ambiguus TaxID=176160 RepID=UPI003CCE3626